MGSKIINVEWIDSPSAKYLSSYQRDSYIPAVYHIFVRMDPKSKKQQTSSWMEIIYPAFSHPTIIHRWASRNLGRLYNHHNMFQIQFGDCINTKEQTGGYRLLLFCCHLFRLRESITYAPATIKDEGIIPIRTMLSLVTVDWDTASLGS